MSRSKSLFAVLALTAILGFCPQLHATSASVKVVLAGSSALWQTLALGTFGVPNSGTPTQGACGAGLGATAPCFHYTTGSFNVVDGRVQTNNDANAIWIVWDSAATPHVWAFVKVDSGVGNRCYFGNPPCYISSKQAVGSWTAANSITVWGATDDTVPPTSIQDAFTQANSGLPAGQKVTASATDIRPEDSLWSTCRSNSKLGMNAFDATDGLGYNTNWTAGTCPATATVSTGTGSAIQSGYPSSTSTANLIAWNITGSDPITGKAVPAFSTYSVGAAPVTFVYSTNGGQLTGLTNATDAQLQQAFSGTRCDADVFGLTSGAIDVYLREPISGTMNTTEANVFRRPVDAAGSTEGLSQETGVGGHNPLTGASVACPSTGSAGGRFRAIGTGEEVKSVLNSKTNNGQDGIGYTFFSYGNVSTIAGSSSYGYTQLDGVDPIFQVYNSTAGAGYDPGQPPSGELPAAANLPAAAPPTGCSSAFPCPETLIWTGELSFPNVRSGAYRAWSLLRVVSTGAALTSAEAVVKASQAYVVTSVPDYIPAIATTATINGTKFTDPGLQLIRSHYQQVDGSGTTDIGAAPVNTGTGEKGGDMGGCILATPSAATQLKQANPGAPCAVRPVNP